MSKGAGGESEANLHEQVLTPTPSTRRRVTVEMAKTASPAKEERGSDAALLWIENRRRIEGRRPQSWSESNKFGSTGVPSVLTASRAEGSRPRSCRMVGAT